MPARLLARSMIASWYVSRGVDAVRHPSEHAEEAAPGIERATERLEKLTGTDLSGKVTAKELRRLVQLHGAAVTLAALALVTGKAPRLAALALVVLTAPVLASNLPVPGEAQADRQARRQRLVQSVAVTGGTLAVALDRHGKPSLAWRVRHARAEREKTTSEP